jgi:AraC-like DNA-binding protein
MHTPVDVDAVRALAFGVADDRAPFDDAMHVHRRHQILFAAQGLLLLETESSQWLLPPQRAAWIPAQVRHRARARGSVRLRTVYLAQELVPSPPATCIVFGVTPLAREMILFAMRWGPAPAHDETGEAFFAALAALAREWVAAEQPYRLPVAKTPELAKAMQFALENMDGEVSVDAAARVAGVSLRTLTRRFTEETGTTWRAFVHTARMLRAMELLAVPGARVGQVAFSVGFKSLGAFTTAFTEFTGETPRDYSRRLSR